MDRKTMSILAKKRKKPEFIETGEMNLQMFAEAVSGRRIIYLYRLLSEAASANATRLAFATENGRTKSKDADSTATKDGSIRTPGTAEVEITSTSVLSKGDTMIDKLEDAMDDDELIEIWEVNLDEPASGGGSGTKFKGMYFQGYITEFEKNSPSDDFTEISLTFGINGSGKRGDVTVSTEQQEEANYVFTDTTKTSEMSTLSQQSAAPQATGAQTASTLKI